MQKIIVPGVVLGLISLGAYFALNQDGYWWTRGQPPSTSELLSRANDRYEDTKNDRMEAREASIEIFDMAIEGLVTTVQLLDSSSGDSTSIKAVLETIGDNFRMLEGKLSLGSRVAHGELSGQLRAFISAAEAGEQIDTSSFKLFSARTIFFFQRELLMPRP